MLVDNAIVITEGMLVAMERGKDKLQAARTLFLRRRIPLLGSTAIAVLAFGADRSLGRQDGRILPFAVRRSPDFSWIELDHCGDDHPLYSDTSFLNLLRRATPTKRKTRMQVPFTKATRRSFSPACARAA